VITASSNIAALNHYEKCKVTAQDLPR